MMITLVFYEAKAEADLKSWEQQFWELICYKQRVEICHRSQREYVFVVYHKHKIPTVAGEYEVVYCIPIQRGLEIDYEVNRVYTEITNVIARLHAMEVNEDDMPDLKRPIFSKQVIYGAASNEDLFWIAGFGKAIQSEIADGAVTTRMVQKEIDQL